MESTIEHIKMKDMPEGLDEEAAMLVERRSMYVFRR